jgi:hypothetical protein
LKIPRNILGDLIKDRQNFKAVELYLELKPLFYTGRFELAKSRSQEIARAVGMSQRAYYYKIKHLQKMGLVWFDNKDLILCSWSIFFAAFGYTPENGRNFKFYRLKNEIDVSFAIRQIIIEENLKAQNKAIDIKIFQNEVLLDRQTNILKQIHEVQQSKAIPAKDKERRLSALHLDLKTSKKKWVNVKNDPEFLKFKSSGKLARLFVQVYKSYETQLKNVSVDYPAVNPIPSISCQGLAALFGCNSKSSGYYWQRKLKARGQVNIKKASIFCADFKIDEFNFAVQNDVDIKGHFFLGQRGVYRRLNNNLIFKPLATV